MMPDCPDENAHWRFPDVHHRCGLLPHPDEVDVDPIPGDVVGRL